MSLLIHIQVVNPLGAVYPSLSLIFSNLSPGSHLLIPRDVFSTQVLLLDHIIPV